MPATEPVGREQTSEPASVPTAPTRTMSGRLQAEWRWARSPYVLPKGIHLFTDFRYVDPGYVDWSAADGERLSATGSGSSLKPGPHVDAFADLAGVPQGIEIRAQPADIGAPLPYGLGGIWGASLVHDEGKYRIWYALHNDWVFGAREFVDKDPAELVRMRATWNDLLLYAESTDGIEWKSPHLDLIDPKEYAANGIVYRNAVFGCSLVTHGGIRAQTWKRPYVFRDPHAPADERYKMVYGAGFGARRDGTRATARAMLAAYRRRWPHEEMDPFPAGSAEGGFLLCVMGATSPDGLRWKTLPEPMALHVTDNSHVICYDENIGRYVWYTRKNWWAGKRRGVGRSESTDFRHFPPLETIIHPSMTDGPEADWYTPCKTIYPGTRDQHLLFSSQFRRRDESGVIHLFSSFDGIHWDRLPGNPVITQGPLGRPYDSWMQTTSDMVALPGNRVGILTCGQLAPHKYPRRGGKRAHEVFGRTTFWATWPAGRLAALEAAGQGSFSTVDLKVPGRKLILNLKTKSAGEIRVEVARTGQGYAMGPAVPGRTFSDCDPIHGDQPAQTVTWHGQSDLGFAENEPIVLRFQISLAKIFSFEVV